MTEVVSAPTGVEQAQYFDDIGNAIGWDKYLDFEADEAQRYLKELPKGEKTYVRPTNSSNETAIASFFASSTNPPLSMRRLVGFTHYIPRAPTPPI